MAMLHQMKMKMKMHGLFMHPHRHADRSMHQELTQKLSVSKGALKATCMPNVTCCVLARRWSPPCVRLRTPDDPLQHPEQPCPTVSVLSTSRRASTCVHHHRMPLLTLDIFGVSSLAGETLARL
eukprot:365942-Chlamydomonas_euryale.AAC.48